MGNKDTGKREKKKPAKPQPKSAPQKREDVYPSRIASNPPKS